MITPQKLKWAGKAKVKAMHHYTEKATHAEIAGVIKNNPRAAHYVHFKTPEDRKKFFERYRGFLKGSAVVLGVSLLTASALSGYAAAKGALEAGAALTGTPHRVCRGKGIHARVRQHAQRHLQCGGCLHHRYGSFLHTQRRTGGRVHTGRILSYRSSARSQGGIKGNVP